MRPRPPRPGHFLSRTLHSILLALALLVGLHGGALLAPGPVLAADEAVSRVLYLPLKVNSQQDPAALAKLADDQLRDLLKGKPERLLDRAESEAVYPVATGWPPPHAAVASSSPAAGQDYVVAGSLTQTGATLSIDVTVLDLLDPAGTKFFFAEARDREALGRSLKEIHDKVAAHANRHIVVSKVSITGNKKIDTGAIVQRVKVKAGSPAVAEDLRTSITEIFKMGYFSDVKVHATQNDDGRDIRFEVVEKDVIGQVKVEGGDEIKEEEIREVIVLVPNNILSNKDLQESIDGIKKLYKDKSFFSTKVAAEVSEPAKGKVDVTFKIKEGPKVFIKDITFTGNKAFTAKELRKILETTEHGWFSWITDSGILNNEIVEQDTSRLAAFYHNHGFIDAKVGKAEIDQKGKWMYINFNIEEGDRYRVGTIDLVGDLLGDKQDLFPLLKLSNEKFFSRQVLREDVLRVTDKYAENGYAFAEVNPTTDKDPVNKRVNATLHVTKKELVHINRILVKGNTRTRDKVIRREMKIKETGLFDATALKESQNKLKRLDFFEEVNVTPEPTGAEGLMDIVVDIKEKPTGNFSVGAGYSSVDSFMFMGEISQNNFLGKGQKLSLQANLSRYSTQYNLSFTEPHLADSNLMFGFDLYDWKREYDDFTRNSQGLGLRFGHPLGEKWNATAGYTFDDTVLSDVKATASQTIKDSQEINITSALHAGISRDTRDKIIDTTLGTFFKSNLTYAGGPVGGDSQFTKMDGAFNHWLPLPLTTTLHNRVAAGVAFANSGGKLPIFEKYYLGGINNSRGFKASSISPRDPVTHEKIGGGKLWYYNLEWIFPIVKDAGLNGLLFFDAGNVYGEHSEWDFNEIKKSVGFGFRWKSPVGPLRLEWGYNLDPNEYEVQDNWDFSVGGAF